MDKYTVYYFVQTRAFSHAKLGLSVKTLQRWDVSGKLPAKRNYSKEIKENLKNAIDKPVQDVAELSNQEIQC
ncbi:MAG: hypothetical protein EAZ09_03315 [Oscillatoriales cyanobacterium]|nr:MAG: hypothetical protein EAZ18_27270 [Oscillatoriales cyanobacterium]TAH24672.1 MAG: hypothetical protein EAZ09_03315 [Oscillatoriales cyanobacterium]